MIKYALLLLICISCLCHVARAFSMQMNQAEYGVKTAMPKTYAQCGRCHTSYALQEEDLGANGKGRRLECSVCGHSWYQSRDRLSTLSDNFEMIELPDSDKERIALNVKEGLSPKFHGAVKLYCGNIAFSSTEDDLREVFSEAGVVGDVALIRDEQGRNRGFGFVTMRTKEGGQKAMDTINGMELAGRNIAVRASNT